MFVENQLVVEESSVGAGPLTEDAPEKKTQEQPSRTITHPNEAPISSNENIAHKASYDLVKECNTYSTGEATPFRHTLPPVAKEDLCNVSGAEDTSLRNKTLTADASNDISEDVVDDTIDQISASKVAPKNHAADNVTKNAATTSPEKATSQGVSSIADEDASSNLQTDFSAPTGDEAASPKSHTAEHHPASISQANGSPSILNAGMLPSTPSLQKAASISASTKPPSPASDAGSPNQVFYGNFASGLLGVVNSQPGAGAVWPRYTSQELIKFLSGKLFTAREFPELHFHDPPAGERAYFTVPTYSGVVIFIERDEWYWALQMLSSTISNEIGNGQRSSTATALHNGNHGSTLAPLGPNAGAAASQPPMVSRDEDLQEDMVSDVRGVMEQDVVLRLAPADSSPIKLFVVPGEYLYQNFQVDAPREQVLEVDPIDPSVFDEDHGEVASYKRQIGYWWRDEDYEEWDGYQAGSNIDGPLLRELKPQEVEIVKIRAHAAKVQEGLVRARPRRASQLYSSFFHPEPSPSHQPNTPPYFQPISTTSSRPTPSTSSRSLKHSSVSRLRSTSAQPTKHSSSSRRTTSKLRQEVAIESDTEGDFDEGGASDYEYITDGRHHREILRRKQSKLLSAVQLENHPRSELKSSKQQRSAKDPRCSQSTPRSPQPRQRSFSGVHPRQIQPASRKEPLNQHQSSSSNQPLGQSAFRKRKIETSSLGQASSGSMAPPLKRLNHGQSSSITEKFAKRARDESEDQRDSGVSSRPTKRVDNKATAEASKGGSKPSKPSPPPRLSTPVNNNAREQTTPHSGYLGMPRGTGPREPLSPQGANAIPRSGHYHTPYAPTYRNSYYADNHVTPVATTYRTNGGSSNSTTAYEVDKEAAGRGLVRLVASYDVLINSRPYCSPYPSNPRVIRAMPVNAASHASPAYALGRSSFAESPSMEMNSVHRRSQGYDEEQDGVWQFYDPVAFETAQEEDDNDDSGGEWKEEFELGDEVDDEVDANEEGHVEIVGVADDDFSSLRAGVSDDGNDEDYGSKGKKAASGKSIVKSKTSAKGRGKASTSRESKASEKSKGEATKQSKDSKPRKAQNAPSAVKPVRAAEPSRAAKAPNAPKEHKGLGMKKMGSWTEVEADIVNELVKTQRAKEAHLDKSVWIKDLNLFKLISLQLQDYGINRTNHAVKNFWNRTGRRDAGWDERANPTPQKACSVQKTKGTGFKKGTAKSGTKEASRKSATNTATKTKTATKTETEENPTPKEADRAQK